MRFRYYDEELTVFFIYSAIFTVVIAGLLLVAVLIYKKSGWKQTERYLWGLGILLGLCVAIVNPDLDQPVMLGLSVGYATAFAGYFFFIGWQLFKCQEYKKQIDEYIESEIEAMLPAPDADLLRIKRTMGYRRDDPNYKKMNGYLERENLTYQWKKKKRLELFYPFIWKKFK